MTTGIALPALLIGGGAAVEYADIIAARQQLQTNVDVEALNGARELTVDQSPATAQRAKLMAQAVAQGLNWTVQTTATADPATGSMTVSQQAHRPSYFGNLVAPDGLSISVTATASSNAKTPLCVLATQSGGLNVASLQGTSALVAANCLVQSDSDVALASGTTLTAGAVRSVGAATGSISPPPVTDSPTIADPFASLNIDVPTTCSDQGIQANTGTQYLNPGVHCGTLLLRGSATLILNPGEHYFVNGSFDVRGMAQITGTDVVLIFKGLTTMSFRGQASVSLEGRHTGPYAGFVLMTDRSVTADFAISADSARKLLGTIYIPNAKFAVSGTGNKVADQSPWTVVVAKDIGVSGSASLTINSSYFASAVPVPTGVGGNLFLTQ